MTKPFFLTTPLYYVNAAPHIGHSYTQVAADCLARYHRLNGDAVHFLTGTDEHGQKIEQAAAAAGAPPQQFVDGVVRVFQDLWTLLNISHDDFIRTTQPRHVRVVQACLQKLRDDGTLVHATYSGWYCTPCETFWTAEELSASGPQPLCLSCQRPVEAVQEDGWYLPLRASQEWLLGFLRSHRSVIQPESRYNEIVSLLSNPLPEHLCITRPKARVGWGIEVPFSPQHVTYVWFDALLNYISAVGYQVDQAAFSQRWPVDVHFIGKDILRHHAVYWPIVLHALGFSDEQMPRLVFAHGWWKVGEQKMSKSLGNIVDPNVVIREVLKSQPFASDVYRYFLLRDVPFGHDGAFSEDALMGRLTDDLANDLGNLVNRTLSMIERYRQGRIPSAPSGSAVASAAAGLAAQIAPAMERVQFSVALEAIMGVVSHANRYIEETAPWKLAKQPEKAAELDTVLGTLSEVIRIVAITLEPFMPSVAAEIWAQLGMGTAPRRLADASRWPGVPAGQSIGAKRVLFPKPEPAA